MSTMLTERLAAALEGRYLIERHLGEGGMATVFLARDLKHDRHVALKVLKPELAAVLGAERFIQEIKTTASLQHPHILPLFDSGQTDGPTDRFLYYVMPFIDGETLRERLTRETQLGIEESVRIAREVGDALDYAHRHGVIHRDIKPENILLQDGRALVADFGIALAVSAAAGGRMTQSGLSLGTPHYMSPEQATAEKELTARSDIYSLGSVLYEMLAGEPPHTGASAQAVIMKIVTEPVRPVTELRKSVPRNVADALAKSLEKLAADRFESARGFADALANPSFRIAGLPGTDAASSAGEAAWKRRALLAGGLAVLAVLGAAGALLLPRGAARAVDASVSATLELPPDVYLNYPTLSFSPDGTRLFASVLKGGKIQLYERRLDEFAGRELPGSVEGYAQWVSPDGQWVAFRGFGTNMIKVPLASGPPVVMDPLGTFGDGYWTPDGTLYYPTNYKSGIRRLRPGASTSEQVTQPDTSAKELGHFSPRLLPDGRHLMYTVFRTPIDSARIDAVDLVSGDRTVLVRGGVYPQYLAGYLLFTRRGTVFAARFDPGTLKIDGDPVPVIEDVAMKPEEGVAAYTVSSTGTMAWIPAAEYDAASNLVWVDRGGRETPALATADHYAEPALSPDGQRIAVALTGQGEAADVWVLDVARGTRTRITSGGGADFGPVWTPDGRALVFSSEQPIFDLYTRPADGSGPVRPLLSGPVDKEGVSFTPDGRQLVFGTSTLPYSQIWRVNADGTKPELVLGVDSDLWDPSLAPDGRWIAFESSESGRKEIQVASYPNVSAGRQAISNEGGRFARWTRGGRELVWRNGPQVMSASFDPATGKAGRPTLLFTADYQSSTRSARNWDVTPDGQKFLFVKRPLDRAPRRIMIVTNWVEQLKRKMAGLPRPPV